MINIDEVITEFAGQGSCCAQQMVRLGLLLKGEENPGLENAAAALCGGLKSGANCGTLSGGCIMLTMFDKQASTVMIQELYAWFDESFGAKYGTINCEDILPDRSLKAETCPPLIKATAHKCAEILTEHGLLSAEIYC